ncbi:DUF5333 domain-containing protein [Paragemmobacter ruber]|uniref:DUF5333 domain-containing protein n=1 Tax=Paragemmobacter ruber TaxID=1985673 RepID=A0ABW9Y8S3_9RHOB|nr:DUF5333 domain-containing protein [Rhodobacter ruber]NBE08986.1 hypothetical protein [Rhodobacter ruber]
MKLAPLSAPLSLVALLAALPAHALEPINTEPHINNVLLQGFIGDAIADNCPALEPRRMRALGELNKLRAYAQEKGYSVSEIRAFVTSDTEKARGKAQAADWLRAKGAEPGKTEEYCRIGREEIAKNSLIGYLLRDTE